MLSHITYDISGFMTCLYSIISPVSLFKTVFIISIGDFRPASFIGDMFSFILSGHANMASWATVPLMVLFAGLSSRNVSASCCVTSSAILAERRGGPTLRGVSILFAGTSLAGNFWFGCTLVGCEGVSVALVTLED